MSDETTYERESPRMSRRRRFGWAIALVAGAGLIAIFTADVIVTGTQWGRQKFITWALGTLNGSFGGRGRLTVGVLHELSGDGIRASNVSLLDTAGVVVVHVNELRGQISYSALFNKTIHIIALDVRGVQLNLKRDFKGPWNVAYIINGGPKKIPQVPGYGDDVRIDIIKMSDAVIGMQYPWAPNVVFQGKARDSVMTVRRKLHDIAVVPLGLLERRRIVLPRVVAHDVLVATPGDDPSSLQLDTLGGTISDPAIRIVQAAGGLKWTPDSLLLDLPAVALPASVGSAKGKVHWDQPGAVRYDVTVNARAGLSDLSWIWDVMPDSGSGSATVRLRTLASADDAEYTLSKLDVSAMKSHVTGDITVVSRPAQMLLQGVDLSFSPMRSELLRRLSYDAVPPEVQGTFRGRLVAKNGGPLSRLQVDRIDATFVDDQVAGAQSSFIATGVVGFGANPTARNVRVSNASVDLRSLRALMPEVPPLDGLLTGNLLVATADLKHANVPELDLNWTDGEGNSSHVSGRATAQFGGRVPVINTELLLDPLSLKAVVRVDTTFPLSSALRGTVSASGALDSLKWTAALVNGASKLNANGLASLRDSMWSVQANTELAEVDLRSWIGRSDLPVTAVNGTVQVQMTAQLRADSTTHISDAVFSADVRQTGAAGLPEFSMRASGALDEARLRIDSAAVLLGGITMDLKGALARDSLAVDTLEASLQADSLGAARPELIRLADMLQPVDSVFAKSLRSYASDTLQGDLSGSAVMVGSLPAFSANVSMSVRAMQVGIVNVRRLFGSVRATGLPDHAHFDATATVDDITGIGKMRLANAEFRLENASPDSGQLLVDVVARDTTALRLRGNYARVDSVLSVQLDTVRFNYGAASWLNTKRALLTSDARGLRLDSLLVRSNQNGLLELNANVPVDGEVSALLRVERFPAGEVASFAMSSTTKYRGLLTGETRLSGTRPSPRIVWNMIGDSVGTATISAPPLVTDGVYENKRLVAHLVLEDSVRSRLRAELRTPIDLSLQSVEKRVLSDDLDADVVVDTLQLSGLPIAVQGVSALRGVLAGRVEFSGTMNRPIATGRLTLDGFAASVDALGITPSEGRVVLVAAQDQLTIEQFRFRSGARTGDTVSANGVLNFPPDKPVTVEAKLVANNARLADQSDGTNLVLSGTVSAKGELQRPDVSASLFVPRASIVVDPLGARSALDLSSAQARELLGETEIPVASGVADPLARLGRHMNVTQASLQLGDEVWVRTPESALKMGGALDIKSSANDLLAFDGEVTANRGTFRLVLSPYLQRNFSVDSGRVRFFGSDAIEPTVRVYATHVVRASGAVDTPIHVAITGTFENLALKLSTDDEVFSGAPEGEVISLLIFGAPTFALNAESQSTVKAVTGVLLPSVGGIVAGSLQSLIPYFNTIQLNTAGGQASELNASLLNNLNVEAGKQYGERTFLRLNGGVCRASSGSNSIQFTTAASLEYRISRGFLAQMGVDQGASPCTQLGTSGSLRRQFGFDLFREWVF